MWRVAVHVCRMECGPEVTRAKMMGWQSIYLPHGLFDVMRPPARGPVRLVGAVHVHALEGAAIRGD